MFELSNYTTQTRILVVKGHLKNKALHTKKYRIINIKRFFSLLLVMFGFMAVQAQENINTSGGDASGTGGSASYSIGQIMYTTDNGSNGSISQGVQQAFEISVDTELKEILGINLSISAFPNPTIDQLTLEINDLEIKTLDYQLFDIQGQCLQAETIVSRHTIIYMSNFVPASYFIRISQGKNVLKSFKIIKN